MTDKFISGLAPQKRVVFTRMVLMVLVMVFFALVLFCCEAPTRIQFSNSLVKGLISARTKNKTQQSH